MLGALGGLAGAATGLKNPADQCMAFLKSRSVQDVLVKRFDLQKRYEAELHEDAPRALEDAARISAGKDGLIKVDVDDKEPAFAAQLANAHVEDFRKLLARLAVTEAQQLSGINEGALRVQPKMAAEAYAGLKAAVTAAQVKLQSMRTYLTEQSPEFKLAKLDEARDGAFIQVVDVAQTPERKSKPKKAMIAVLTTLATGFVLLLFVFMSQAWRNGLNDEATAQKLNQLFSRWSKAEIQRFKTACAKAT